MTRAEIDAAADDVEAFLAQHALADFLTVEADDEFLTVRSLIRGGATLPRARIRRVGSAWRLQLPVHVLLQMPGTRPVLAARWGPLIRRRDQVKAVEALVHPEAYEPSWASIVDASSTTGVLTALMRDFPWMLDRLAQDIINAAELPS